MTIRLTQKRQAILDVIKQHYGTLSAKEIHQQLPTIDLATIYRNLDLFVQEKLIKAIQFDSTETVYEYQETPHQHAICTTCKRVIHFAAPEKKIQQLLQLEDFSIDEIELTVRGTCKH